MKLETLLLLGIAGYVIWLVWWDQQCKNNPSVACATSMPPFATQVNSFLGV